MPGEIRTVYYAGGNRGVSTLNRRPDLGLDAVFYGETGEGAQDREWAQNPSHIASKGGVREVGSLNLFKISGYPVALGRAVSLQRAEISGSCQP